MAALPRSAAPLARAALPRFTFPDAGVMSAGKFVEVLYKFHIQSVRSIYIAEKNNRKVAPQVILDLNELLLVGSCVGGVSDRKVARELLFDGHTRGCVRFRRRASEERIHPEMADAEEFFYAPSEPR